MFLAQITGSVVSTQKVASMVGQKLLIVEPLRVEQKTKKRLSPTGRTFIAVDTVGAGDTFAGVFAFAHAEGLGLLDSVRMANTAAALATLKPGAQEAMPVRAEIEKMLSLDGR